MHTFALGDLVAERNEPYPMTGEVITQITRVGATVADDQIGYGVRFTATADVITTVDPADIELACPDLDTIGCPQFGCGAAVPNTPDDDGLIFCGHCGFLFTRAQVA